MNVCLHMRDERVMRAGWHIGDGTYEMGMGGGACV